MMALETPTKALAELKDYMQTLGDLSGAMSLLSWDTETKMPAKAAPFRARQRAALSTLLHRMSTDPKLGQWLEELEPQAESLSVEDKALLREVRRDYDQATKLPESLVRELSETTSKAHTVWVDARKTKNFSAFAPLLKRIVELNQQQAEVLGYEGSPYNALLDLYEPGLTTEKLDPIFNALESPIRTLLENKSAKFPRPEWMSRPCPKEKQEAMVKRIISAMNFDWEAGRIDEAPHPFCSSSSVGDVRLTNRYFENDWTSCIFSAMHEAGHGLYEQGIRDDLSGGPLGHGVSLGIHESQSRLWENMVGRSRAFVTFLLPLLNEVVPEQVEGVSEDEFYTAINRISPSCIRVEADEVTYNLHVLLRYRLEKQLIEGTLSVEDVPEAWNEAMNTLLGITPANDAEGCLQDIHWSHGTFGYFPTYTLGNLYAAQFFNQAKQALPQLEFQISKGELAPLRSWLKTEIHQHGSIYWPDDLSKQVTGNPLQVEPFTTYLATKY